MTESTRALDLEGQLDLREDRYERNRVLGTGGMGEVVLVRDRRIGREIAVKTVRVDIASPAARRAFLAEARMQAQLEHPAIIPVYDIGIDEAGREFFTMRAIAGITLSKVLSLLRSGDRETSQEYTTLKLLDVFRRLCLVVEYAHQKGVIHRDLKPANVMLGEYGEIYVLDWGLAQKHGDPKESTDPGSPVLGTPGYIAPEQTFTGSQVDGRADVYALGAILFEILSLQRLHVGRDSNEILKSTRRKHSVTAQQRAPERDIPPELDAAAPARPRSHPRSANRRSPPSARRSISSSKGIAISRCARTSRGATPTPRARRRSSRSAPIARPRCTASARCRTSRVPSPSIPTTPSRARRSCS